MRSARLGEAQFGIKIARRNINKSRYEDENTLITESKGELKKLLMKVTEESEHAGLQHNLQNMASGPITSW